MTAPAQTQNKYASEAFLVLLTVGHRFSVELEKAPGDVHGAYRRAVKKAKAAGELVLKGYGVVPDHILFGSLKRDVLYVLGVGFRHKAPAALQ
jgi:hypothetical protein